MLDRHDAFGRAMGLRQVEDLDINVEQGVLTISGQTTTDEERKERNYLVREHRTGRFSRSLRLPAT